MTDPHPQPEYTITEEELLIVEHGCIYPDTDECVGKRCKYHDPNPVFRENIVCLLNEHDVADKVRSRTHTPAAPAMDTAAPAVWRCCEFQSRPINHEPIKCDLVEQAAQAERERVLKTIEIYVNDGKKSCDESSKWDSGYANCCRAVLECIKSLRSGGK